MEVVASPEVDLSLRRVRVRPPATPADQRIDDNGEREDRADADDGDEEEAEHEDGRTEGEPFLFRVLLVNRGSADAHGIELDPLVDAEPLGKRRLAHLAPAKAHPFSFRWTPPAELRSPGKVFSVLVSSGMPDAMEEDNRGVAAFMASDLESDSAGMAYPDQGRPVEVLTDAPWRVDAGRGYIPVLVWFPSVRYGYLGEHGRPNLKVSEVSIAVQPPGGAGQTLFRDTPAAPPAPWRTFSRNGDKGIIDDLGGSQERERTHGMLYDVAGHKSQIATCYHRIIRLAVGAATTAAGGNDVNLQTSVEYEYPLPEHLRRHIQREAGLPWERVPTRANESYRKALRVHVGGPLPKLPAHDGIYLDPHNHTIAEWSTDPVSLMNLLAPRKALAGPIQMLKECAYVIGMVKDFPERDQTYPGTLVTTDHNVYFSTEAKSDVREETPPVGPTKVPPFTGPGVNAQEFINYVNLFAHGAGEEISLRDGGFLSILAPHALAFNGPHVDGPWHGQASAPTITQVLEKYKTGGDGRHEGFLFAAHPRRSITDFPDEVLTIAQGIKRGTEEGALRDTPRKEFIFKGLQVWNMRDMVIARTRAFDGLDPYNPQTGPFANSDRIEAGRKSFEERLTENFVLWSKRAAKGFRWKRDRGDANSPLFLQKLYLLAGSDAHGDFNYDTDQLAQVAERPPAPIGIPLLPVLAFVHLFGASRTVDDSAYAKVRTYALKAPGGDESTGLRMMSQGQSVLTDGPLAWLDLDSNGKFDVIDRTWHDQRPLAAVDQDGLIGGEGPFDGKRTMLVIRGDRPLSLNAEAASTTDFGPRPAEIRLHRVGLATEWPGEETVIPVDTPKQVVPVTEPSVFVGEARTVAPNDLGQTRGYANGIWALPVDVVPIILAFRGNSIPQSGMIATWTFPLSMNLSGEAPRVFVQPLNSYGDSTGAPVQLQIVRWEPTSVASTEPDEAPLGVPHGQLVVTNADSVIGGVLEYPPDDDPTTDHFTWVIWIEGLRDANGNELNPVAKTFAKVVKRRIPPPPEPPDGGDVPDGEIVERIMTSADSSIRFPDSGFTARIAGDPEVAVVAGSVTFVDAQTVRFKIQVGPGAQLGPHDLVVETRDADTGAALTYAYAGWIRVLQALPVSVALSVSTVTQGSAVDVAVSGTNTHFDTSTGVTVSGTGVTATVVGVTDATHMTVRVAADQSAAPTGRTITVATQRTSPSGQVVAETATTTFSITPATVPPPAPPAGPTSIANGETATYVWTVNNAAIQFPASGFSAFFVGDPEVIVPPGSVSFPDPGTVRFTIQAGPGAQPGPHDLSIRVRNLSTGLDVTFAYPAFLSVTAAPSTSIQLSTYSLTAGTTTDVQVTGTNTHFDATTTVTVAGTGVTAAVLSVADGTHLTARMAVDPNAATTGRDVTVTTFRRSPTGLIIPESEMSTIAILAPAPPPGPPIGASSVPNGGFSTYTWTVTGPAFQFPASGLTVLFPSDPEVALLPGSLAFPSPSTAVFTVPVGPGATLGPHDLTLRTRNLSTGQDVTFTYAGFLTVAQALPTSAAMSSFQFARGTSTDVAVTGTNTHFDPTTTVVVSDVGVTATVASLVDGTHMTVRMTVATNAPLTGRLVTITTLRLSPTGLVFPETEYETLIVTATAPLAAPAAATSGKAKTKK